MAGPQGLSYPAHLTGTHKASRFSGEQCQEINSCHSKPAVLGWWSWVCAAARWADGTALHRVVPVIQRGSFLPLSQGWINVPPHCWGFKALCWWGKLFSFWQEKRQCWSPSCLLFLNISYFPPPKFLISSNNLTRVAKESTLQIQNSQFMVALPLILSNIV